jgi:hypothetical protein
MNLINLYLECGEIRYTSALVSTTSLDLSQAYLQCFLDQAIAPATCTYIFKLVHRPVSGGKALKTRCKTERHTKQA